MKIEYKDNDIILTIPQNIIEISEIQNFIDLIKYKEIVSKSTASQKDADNLAEEINQSFWEKNQSH